MDIRQLRHFAAVAETLHFGRAADRLGMTQPPLSQSILALEREIGAALFVRTKRSVALTSFGEQWLRQAEYLKQALSQVGIDVTLRSEDTATWLRRVYTDYDFDINEPFLSQGVDPSYGLNKQYLTSQI